MVYRIVAHCLTRPHPSSPDDRPFIKFEDSLDENENENGDAMHRKYGRVNQGSMICYNWTNDVTFFG